MAKSDDTYESWTTQQLHDELANRKLPVSGSKDEMMDRLEADDVNAPDIDGVTTVDGRAAPNVPGMEEYEASFSDNKSVAMAGETAAVTSAKAGNEASQSAPGIVIGDADAVEDDDE